MAKRYLLGSGDLSKEIIAAFFLNGSPLDGVFDDYNSEGIPEYGIAYKGKFLEVETLKESELIIGFGSTRLKQRIFSEFSSNSNLKWPRFIHETSVLLDKRSIQFGKGSIVSSACILTRKIEIGEAVFINLNCTIGHDVCIGDFSSIMPSVNISGHVNIGEGVYIGSGATILNGISIGPNAIVGAGAVVNKNVDEGVTVVGVPARPIK